MESLSRPSHRRKLSSAANGASFSAKNAYDDVFSGLPNKRGAPPSRAVWDYAEIFGASRGSSIPVLDLSGLEDRAGGSGEDFRSSKLDYSMIFGGFGEEDIALPYEDVVAKRGKQRSSSKARTRSQGSENFASSEGNKIFSHDSSDQSCDGKKHFNMSYHKTNQGTEDGSNGTTHIAQLHAVPGFTYFIDETAHLKTTDAETNKRPGRETDPHVSTKQSSEDAVEGRDRSSWDKFHFSGNLSNESDPSKVTKPSSSRVSENRLPIRSKSSFVASKTGGFQRVVDDSSSSFSDEELDINSAAAVSAAALKKAIENAQESIRLAKELMEKHKDGIPGHQKRSSRSGSKVGDKEEHRKGRNSNNTKAKNMVSQKRAFTCAEEGAQLRNGAIDHHFKHSKDFSTDWDINSECQKESTETPGSDAAETGFREMLNGEKHEAPTIMSQRIEEKNDLVTPSLSQASEIKVVKTIYEMIGLGEGSTKSVRPTEKSPDLGNSVTNMNVLERADKLGENATNLDSACIVSELGQSENSNVINEFEISKKTDNIFGDLGNLEKIHKGNFEFQILENDTLINEFDNPFKNEKEKREYFECNELPKVVEDVHDCKQINRRVRKTWNKKEIELEHIGKGLLVENEDKAQVGFAQERCKMSHRVSQEGEENDERSNGVCKPEIHECKETEHLEEEHVRLQKRTEEAYIYKTSDVVRKPETHDLEYTEKKLDEEHARAEERVREVYNNEVINFKEMTDVKNQHIEAKQGAEEIENAEKATGADEEYQEMNVNRNGVQGTICMQSEADKSKNYHGIDVTLEAADELGAEEIESTKRASDTDEEYQERNLTLDGAEETAFVQSGADESESYQGIDVSLEAAEQEKPYPSFSAFNGYASCWSNEIQEDCTSQVNESSGEKNEQAVSYKENEGLHGGADTFCELEDFNKDDVQINKESCILRENKASDTTSELQNALEGDTSKDHFCDASKENLGFSCMKYGQEIPNEMEDSETDGLTHNTMQNEREDFGEDSLTNITNENVIECQSDDVPEIQTSEEVTKSAFSDIRLGEKIIADNGKESELSSNAVNGEYLRVEESSQDEESIKEDGSILDNEADEKDVQMVHKDTSTAENEKEQEPSWSPLNKNEESRIGDKEIKTEENKESSNAKKIFVAEENDNKKSREKVVGDKDQCKKVDVGKKERERDRDRIVVERAIREARERAFAEARERAERAAVERATAEVRQRVLTEARGKVEKSSSGNKTSVDKASAGNKTSVDKASAGNKTSVDKASVEAKLRAERAAVERATAEARSRALEKALSQKTTAEVKVVAEKLGKEKYSGASRENVLRHSFSSSDLERFNETTESAQRRKARLERHQRIMERAAKALAEKNRRDLLAQKEQVERNRLAEVLDADIKRWASGKEGNLRALLSTLQYILGPDSGWQPISLTEIITTDAVKKAYRKSTLYVHPDKLQQRGASIQQKYICEKVFDLLKAAWNKFNSEER